MMTTAPIPHHHVPHLPHLPHPSLVVVRRFLVAVLIVLAIVLLLAGDTNGAAGSAVVAVGLTGWAFAGGRRARR